MARIKNLTQSLLTSEFWALSAPYIAIDDSSLSEANKLLLKSFFTTTGEDIVIDNDEYHLVSTKALLELLATESQIGLLDIASNDDITDKTSNGALVAAKLGQVATVIESELFVGNEDENQSVKKSDATLIDGSSLQWGWVSNDSDGMGTGLVKRITPPLDSGLGYVAVRVNMIVKTNLSTYLGVINISLPAGGGATEYALGSTGINIRLHTDGVYAGFIASTAVSYFSAAVEALAIVKSV